MNATRYQWKILQPGQCPVRPARNMIPLVEHRCTVTLVWREGEEPSPDNSIVVDPCFTQSGLRKAGKRLERIGAQLHDIGYYFETHSHYDHLLNLGDDVGGSWRRFDPAAFPGIELAHLPGHAPDLHALVFETEQGENWVVGDAILDREYLLDWGYYHLNGYQPAQIAESWRSVAKIVSTANVVIPGHGNAIAIDAELVEKLIASFEQAEHADLADGVLAKLKERSEKF